MAHDKDFRPLINCPDHNWAGMDREEALRTAGQDAREGIALLIGRLADRILGRPIAGEDNHDEWMAEHEQRDTPTGRKRLAEWHLVKMQIERELGLDHTGNVVNARHYGASWSTIGQACGITKQAAYDRWAMFENTALPTEAAAARCAHTTDAGEYDKTLPGDFLRCTRPEGHDGQHHLELDNTTD